MLLPNTLFLSLSLSLSLSLFLSLLSLTPILTSACLQFIIDSPLSPSLAAQSSLILSPLNRLDGNVIIQMPGGAFSKL